MPEMTPVPKDHPLMKAWEMYLVSDDFDAAEATPWVVFVAGFIAGAKWQKPETEIAQIRVDDRIVPMESTNG